MAKVLLDTNVLSELIRPQPDLAVTTWFNAQYESLIFTTAISQAEMQLGIALLPSGKRRDGLAVAVDNMFVQNFAGRILAFDNIAASEYALLVASRRKVGLAISTEDAQIAAIALSHKMILATRNTKDFEQIDGLKMINPWKT